MLLRVHGINNNYIQWIIIYINTLFLNNIQLINKIIITNININNNSMNKLIYNIK